MKIARKLGLALVASALSTAVLAQSTPGLIRGQVPTAEQWNHFFAVKQDLIPYTTVNKAGDTMLGRLVTNATTTSRAGFNVPTGLAPTSPVSGDLWATTSGLFVRIGSTTIGPLSGATSSSFSATLPLAVTFPAGVTNYALNYDSNFALVGSNLAFASIASGNALANSTGFSAEPTSTTITALIDRAICSTQGDLLYRNATAWVCLATGTSGQILQTGGAAANLAWSTATFPTTVGALGTILRSDGTNWVATTATYPSTVASQSILYASSSNVVAVLPVVNGSVPNYDASGNLTNTATPTIGITGTTGASMGFRGATSGTATVLAQAVAGVTSLVLPNASGTFAVNVNAPLSLSATTGLISWSGTSGGIPYFSSTTTAASSALLAANQIVLGGGAATAPATLGSLGTTTTVLHGNAAGAPTFGAVALASDVSGQLPLTSGGTNANLTASNGGVFYSTASAGAILSGTVTAGQHLQSGASAAPSWTTATYPATTTTQQILYSSAANVVGGLSVVNGSIPNYGSSGTLSNTVTPVIGVAGTSVGSIAFANLTTGSVTLQPVTGALGSAVLSLPAITGTLITADGTFTLTGKTYNTAGSGNAFSINATAVSTVVPVGVGGTNCNTASGTCLDNITAFSSTGFLTRTGSNTYAFQSATNGVTLANLAQIATNTVLGNSTSGTANVAALAVGTCSTSSSALIWTTNAGFGCNTSINAATLGSATFAAPGPIGSGTASTGAFSTLSASSTVSGTGFSTYLASPPAIGGTTPAAGTHTTLVTTGLVDVQSAWKTSTQSAPAQITANTDNYNPSSVNCSTSTTLLINSDAARNITGMAGGVAGCRMNLINNGSFSITLSNETTSTAANRFGFGADFVLTANGAVTLLYDGVASRWRNAAAANGAAAAGTVTSVICGTGLSGGTITTSGTCAMFGYAVLQIINYTSAGSTTYTPSAGIRAILFEAIGAGGGGGGVSGAAAQTGVAGGGGGGACARLFTTTIAGSYAIVIGAGGTGGAAGANAGADGGDTTVATTQVVAKGASGGTAGATSATNTVNLGGAGGATGSSTGDVVYRGQPGGPGISVVAASGVGLSGYGGASACLSAAGSSSRGAAGAGGNGDANSGSGGSGAMTASAVNRAGGDGGSGYIRITEYK